MPVFTDNRAILCIDPTDDRWPPCTMMSNENDFMFSFFADIRQNKRRFENVVAGKRFFAKNYVWSVSKATAFIPVAIVAYDRINGPTNGRRRCWIGRHQKDLVLSISVNICYRRE